MTSQKDYMQLTESEFREELGALGETLIEDYGWPEAARIMEEDYRGKYPSREAYCMELCDNFECDAFLRGYIAYDRMARDLAMSDITFIDVGFDECHVFAIR